jgi:signal transduction histidine kinase
MTTASCCDLLAPDAPADGSLAAPLRSPQGRLLHGYLHKTSNSLCGIKGYASLIAASLTRDPEAARWARRILAEVERLEEVYRSVQDMAFPCGHPPSGRGELPAVVARAVGRARQDHPQLVVVWREDMRARLLLPEHDLEVALTELLRNSAESRAPAGAARVRVRLTCGPAGKDRLALTVADDGPGMEPSLLSRAAHPFVTTKEGHLGIGLARVDTIMDLYGLGWSLDSRPAGGTRVVLEVGRAVRGARRLPRGKGKR